MQSYFKSMNLSQVKMMFSLNMKTTRTIKSHFYCNKHFAAQLWQCEGTCLNTDSISHIAYNCPQYEHLKRGKNIESSDADLCQFFTEVIQLRDETQPSGVFQYLSYSDFFQEEPGRSCLASLWADSWRNVAQFSSMNIRYLVGFS